MSVYHAFNIPLQSTEFLLLDALLNLLLRWNPQHALKHRSRSFSPKFVVMKRSASASTCQLKDKAQNGHINTFHLSQCRNWGHGKSILSQS
jgi:hypothetical protein